MTRPPVSGEPSTKRGRVLLDDLRALIPSGLWTLIPSGLWTPFREEQITRSILAIEAEAARSEPAAEGLRAALELLIDDAIGENEGCPHHYGNLTYSCLCVVPVERIDDALAAAARATPPALDVERLIRAFYNTPRKPRLEETAAEHIGRAATEYARLTEGEER